MTPCKLQGEQLFQLYHVSNKLLVLQMLMMSDRFVLEEEFAEFGDTKGLIRIRKSKDRKYNDQKKKDIKGQTTIFKTYI